MSLLRRKGAPDDVDSSSSILSSTTLGATIALVNDMVSEATAGSFTLEHAEMTNLAHGVVSTPPWTPVGGCLAPVVLAVGVDGGSETGFGQAASAGPFGEAGSTEDGVDEDAHKSNEDEVDEAHSMSC